MSNKENFTEILREKYPYLISEYGVRRIELFGSHAKGKQTDDSDNDIVAEFERSIGLEFVEFMEHLETALGRRPMFRLPKVWKK